MQAGDVLDTFDHPNQERYPGQKVHAVAIEEAYQTLIASVLHKYVEGRWREDN